MTTCVFELATPRRPTISDVGGGAKQDDSAYPPNPVTDPAAADYNQMSLLAVRAASVQPVALLSVHYATSAATITSLACVNTNVAASGFTLTQNGNGDVSITYPANAFPSAAAADPDASLTGATPALIACETISSGARVRTSQMYSLGGGHFSLIASGVPFNLRFY